ncbi:hypothetical protein GJ699_01780 [Duganella sp. FT80W]|uniref:Peptidase A2 domain-containing protein n=1 Tax=Duganella guangzhouensis TaxID=2666084 RepID=A0A6I2KTQ2_9BURK|nr:hypothetical protein [Duganella guangzhouensis]MRW88710.1 hypothetical protein [Duganella guangzhouensis]
MIVFSAHAEWNKFIWAESTVLGLESKKAALLFPVKIDQWSCYMQYDTGVDASILYRNNLPNYYKDALSSEKLLVKDFSVTGIPVRHATFSLIYERNEPGPMDCEHDGSKVVGSLGNDEFLQGSLSLDLRNARYQFHPGAYELMRGRYESAELELASTGKGVVPVLTMEDGKKQSHKMLLDTGSATAGIIIYLKKNWMSLTGVKDGKATSFSTQRFGKMIFCLSAPLKEKLSLNEILIPVGTAVTYCQIPDEEPSEENPIFGIIGLSLFSEKTVTLDYFSKKIYFEDTLEAPTDYF